jgi:hypothetical protein
MPGRLGPRVAIEALFLIALAGAAAYADLASKWILLVMAGGWLIVALLELTADRIWAAAPPWRRPYYAPVSPPRSTTAAAPGAPAAVEPLPAADVEAEPRPEAEPAVPAPEAVTMIASRAEPVASALPEAVEPEAQAGPNPGAEPEADALPKPEQEATDTAPPKLEPLQPEPKRRWFRRRERQSLAAEAPEIEMPKHVRLLPASERTDRSSDEVTEFFDAPKSEDRNSR